MTFSKSFLFILFTSFFISSCSSIKKMSVPKKPVLSVTDFRVSSLSLKEVELTFDIEVDNPNPVALTLSSYDYDLNIEGQSFIKGNQVLSTRVEANQSTVVSVPVTFTFRELYNTFSTISSKEESAYAFLANLNIKVPVLGLIEVPIEKEGSFPVVKAPTISVAAFSVTDLSFTSADIELGINLSNPNNFKLSIQELDYEVNFNGLKAIDGTSTNLIEIAENQTRTIKIPATFNFLELGAAAYDLITGGEPFEYVLSGSATVGASLPFFESSSFNFDKSGMVDILR